jgi:hypothetical protein
MTSVRSFVVAFIAAGSAAFALALLNTYAARHGGHPMPGESITTISMVVAGLALFVVHQRRRNTRLVYAEAAVEADAKTYAAVADRAVVYVFRDAFFARLVGFQLEVDGTAVGQTRGKTFFRLELAPGVRRFASTSALDGSRSETPLTLYPGQMCFLEHNIAFAAKGPNHSLLQVNSTAAKPRVTACRMLAIAPPTGTLATA